MNAFTKHSVTCVWNQSSWHWWAATGLLCVWHSLEHLLIDDAVDQWPAHLRACVRANGRHFWTYLVTQDKATCKLLLTVSQSPHNVVHLLTEWQLYDGLIWHVVLLNRLCITTSTTLTTLCTHTCMNIHMLRQCQLRRKSFLALSTWINNFSNVCFLANF